MALDAQSPADRAEQLIELTGRLTRRLAADLQALEGGRPHEIAAQREETARLANLYRRESARVKAEPALLAGAPSVLKQQLAQATVEFEATLKAFEQAVKAATTLTEGLVRAVAAEIARQKTPTPAYGPGPVSRARSEPAVALNRQA